MGSKLKSEKFLAKELRASASKKQLLEALEMCENQFHDISKEGIYAVYVSINTTLLRLAKDIKKLDIQVDDSKNEAFDNFIKFSDKIGSIVKNLDVLKSTMLADDVDEAKKEIDESKTQAPAYITPEQMAKG